MQRRKNRSKYQITGFSINKIQKKKRIHKICTKLCMSKMKIQYITHWGKCQEKSLQHFRGKIFWGMSGTVWSKCLRPLPVGPHCITFIDSGWTDICKQPFLTQIASHLKPSYTKMRC